MNKVFKLFLLVGILFIISASIMSFAYGFTIGNAIAFFTGGICVAFGLWFKKLPSFFKKIILITTGVSIIAFLTITTILIISGTKNTVTYTEDAVLVLGCGIRGETPLPTLVARLDKCVEYHSKNPNALIIVSGGQGNNEDITEAEAMRGYLTKKGINNSLIIKEELSRKTTDNMEYSKQILDALFGNNKYTIACITSDYHTFRTKLTAKKYGLKIRSLSSSVKWYLRPSAYSREALSVCKFLLFG